MKIKVIITFLLIGTLVGCSEKNERKVLLVKAIQHIGKADLGQVSALLEEQTEIHQINTINWEAFPYMPKVAFRIAHYNNEIWIKYYINEAHVLASRTKTNSATHKDSCLEFFLDPKGDGNYYNFEVNAIGTVHLAYGPNIGKRNFVSPKLIEDLIRVKSSLGEVPFGELSTDKSWELTMAIPANLLVENASIQLKGLNARANFYKCGDESTVPHYLSWNPVGTDRPNFHSPHFFGTLIFE